MEFGVRSGAYQREFDRMFPGLDQKDSWRYLQEMLPLLKRLRAGDVAHDGTYWQFPSSTSCPKPLQTEVPIWVAARSPITFDYAIAHDCNIMSWPLTQPFSEAGKDRSMLDDSGRRLNPGYSGKFAMIRHTVHYDSGSTTAMSHAIAAEIPRAESRVVPHLKHLGLIERPEPFSAPFFAFLDRVVR
ncbi:LLM class flavin-dependent oxidoreductase [uncultured Roseovarius sp.]|uniref:LLM class flavin-dependent oxidoreductase n=1 Tax=uncultured Roseovarius sp. TaxID=293344 RepID=UPI00261C46EA|nr:LLM class flavin-dependent oxidoreductase [uncultured Roseovarius sp.]